MCGLKDAENRSRKTNFLGVIGIHASKKESYAEWEAAVGVMKRVHRFATDELAEEVLFGEIGGLHSLPKGVILGTAELTDCRLPNVGYTSPWHADGKYGLYLKNPVLFKTPIPARGQLGFWNFDLENHFGRKF